MAEDATIPRAEPISMPTIARMSRTVLTERYTIANMMVITSIVVTVILIMLLSPVSSESVVNGAGPVR